ncbi:unnamed protein product [Ceutorhynchus assimilis]|uniref:Kazal-like domain-containing protein n=1 Tax=Ceutorhynchus assimilis TaxID=467358 RepID=A0A9N9MQ53_9CUCU|nr:unnamed protein product [Ceutorhynchus assimilis]
MDKIYSILTIAVLGILCIHKSSCQVDFNAFSGSQGLDNDFNQVNTNNQDTNLQQSSTPVTTTTSSAAFRACFDACQTIQNYNPVCGSDGVTYNNQFRLQCARRCGQAIQMQRMGTCSTL